MLHGQANNDQQPSELVCWLLDTRDIWPGDKIASAVGAAECIALTSPAEQKTIHKKMFIADARMSLASALLKRLFVAKALGIPWSEVLIGRKDDETHGKPCAIDEYGAPIKGIDFNVSHQAGLVSLTGWNGRARKLHSNNVVRTNDRDIMVGADIVCVNERNSASNTIEMDGLEAWVDIYDSVFSNEERRAMKYEVDHFTLLDGSVVKGSELGQHGKCVSRFQNLRLTTSTGKELSFSSNRLIDAKIRRFYAYFCYKEAYIKLSGEALLAPWLKELEFHNVRSPRPGTPQAGSMKGVWGEEVDDVEVRLRSRTVKDVKMKLQAFEENFMLASSIQGAIEGLHIPLLHRLDLKTDILAHAI